LKLFTRVSHKNAKLLNYVKSLTPLFVGLNSLLLHSGAVGEVW